MGNQMSSYPDTYAAIKTATLLRAFIDGPARIRQAIADLTDQDLTARPRKGKWSIKEVVIHLCEAETMGAVRIRQTFAQPGSTYAFYDQDTWAEVGRYNHADRNRLETSLEMFAALRQSTAWYFEHASDVEWRHSAHHPEVGEMTLRNQLEAYADHSERHLAQILEMRQLLGKPLDMELILPERLY